MKTESNTYNVHIIKANEKSVNALLDANRGNRPISHSRVEQLVRDIRNHKWRNNGSTIVIDADGNLMDGQHRLTAIKMAGYPSDISLVIVQLPTSGDEAYSDYLTMNTGRTGAAAQMFTRTGLKNATSVAAICRMFFVMKSNLDRSVVPSRHEMAEIHSVHRDTIDFWATQRNHDILKFQTSSLAAFALAECAYGDRRLIQDFANKVGNGTGLVKGTPAYRLFAFYNTTGGKHVSPERQVETLSKTLHALWWHIVKGEDFKIESLCLKDPDRIVRYFIAMAKERMGTF